MTNQSKFHIQDNPRKRLAYLVLTKSYHSGNISKAAYDECIKQLGITNEE